MAGFLSLQLHLTVPGMRCAGLRPISIAWSNESSVTRHGGILKSARRVSGPSLFISLSATFPTCMAALRWHQARGRNWLSQQRSRSLAGLQGGRSDFGWLGKASSECLQADFLQSASLFTRGLSEGATYRAGSPSRSFGVGGSGSLRGR